MNLVAYKGPPEFVPIIYFAGTPDYVTDTPRRSAFFEAQAEFILSYNVLWRAFTVKKSRFLDPSHELTCQALVKEHLGYDITPRGSWVNEADESLFLLQFG